jgi:hypothetical protein
VRDKSSAAIVQASPQRYWLSSEAKGVHFRRNLLTIWHAGGHRGSLYSSFAAGHVCSRLCPGARGGSQPNLHQLVQFPGLLYLSLVQLPRALGRWACELGTSSAIVGVDVLASLFLLLLLVCCGPSWLIVAHPT